MRIQITFSKTNAMRYTGHLDVHRTLERTLRRARLPLKHSQGYTRRPKMSLAAPLPLGMTSECELAEIWLDESLPLAEIAAAVHKAAPPGIQLHQVEELDPNQPKLVKQIISADFVTVLLEPAPGLGALVEQLLAAETLPRERRKKTYDLRPLVLALRVIEPDEAGHQQLYMTLNVQEGATGRPDEVLRALGIDPNTARCHRVKLNLKT